MLVKVKHIAKIALRHATFNTGPGSGFFASRRNRPFFSLEVARQLPTPMKHYVWYGKFFNSLIRVVPAGNVLFRRAARSTFSESAPLISLTVGASRYTLLGDDPRICIVPGDTDSFRDKLSAQIASRCDLLLDVGANYGSFSLAAVQLSLDSQPRIIAFEANPRLCVALTDNLQHGGVTRWTVAPCALGSEVLPAVRFTIPAHSTGSAKALTAALRAHDERWRNDSTTVEVRQETLDNYLRCPEFTHLDSRSHLVFMKIDVEGAESSVLLGSQETISRHRPIIYLEVNNRHTASVGGDICDIINFLVGYGYTHYIRERNLARLPIQALENEAGAQDVIIVHPSVRDLNPV